MDFSIVQYPSLKKFEILEVAENIAVLVLISSHLRFLVL